MSINITTLNNNKSVFKGPSRDIGINNGIENQSVFNTQPSNAFTTFRGPKQLQVSAGTTESFGGRSMQIDDDSEIITAKFNSPSECFTGNGGIFIAEHDYIIESVKFRSSSPNVAGLTAQLYKANSGNSFVGAGTAITAKMSLTTAAHVVSTGALISDAARTIAKNQAVGLVFADAAPDEASGVMFSIKARRIIPGTRSNNYLE
jgi:hypothetical protein